jgi:hypothetical protein
VLVYGGAVVALTVRVSIEVALSRNLVPSYDLSMWVLFVCMLPVLSKSWFFSNTDVSALHARGVPHASQL